MRSEGPLTSVFTFEKKRRVSKEDPILAIIYIHFNDKMYEECFSDLIRKSS